MDNNESSANDQRVMNDGSEDKSKHKKILILLLLLLLFLLILILFIWFLRVYLISKRSMNVSNNNITTNLDAGNTSQNNENPSSDNTINNWLDRLADKNKYMNTSNNKVVPTTEVSANKNMALSFTFDDSKSMRVGETLTIPVMLHPGDKKITTIDLELSFPSHIIMIEKAVSGGALPTTLRAASISGGKVKIIVGGSPSQIFDASKPVVNLTVKAVGKGQATIASSPATRVTALTYRDYLPIDISSININVK